MRPLTRRRVLATGAATALAGLAGCGSDSDDGTAESATETESTETDTATETETTTEEGGGGSLEDASVAVERVASGLVSPVDFFTFDGRRFVVDQPGVVYELTDDGRREEPYLDIRDRIVDLEGYSEQGLLGVAPHPEFADDGRLFVRYSAPSREGTPDDYSHTFVLSELTVDPGAESVDGDDERTLMELPQPQANHNAGAVGFAPDGYLYVATGDGGGADDVGTGHVDDWYDAVEGGNGQDVTENLLGSILRIDVENEGEDRPYGIPEDNPLVGSDGLDEQYAWGLRNPWRFSFDEHEGGDDWDFYVADVGQGAYEEVNVVERGGNYGWNVREGTHCFGADDCPSETPDGEPLASPVIEYPHSGDGASGISVIGGYVARDVSLPNLDGAYVFADWLAEGRLFAADPAAEETPWPVHEVPVTGDVTPGPRVNAFGRDDEALYLLTTKEEGEETGEVFRLVSAD